MFASDCEPALNRSGDHDRRPLDRRNEIANGKIVEPPDISILFLDYESIGWGSSVNRRDWKAQR